MASARIQHILLSWVEKAKVGKGGIKGGRKKPLNLLISKSMLRLGYGVWAKWQGKVSRDLGVETTWDNLWKSREGSQVNFALGLD